MKTNRKGISLIVLAITIIVMIILASAIILSLSGKNVIGSAKEATSTSDIANAKHAVAVAKSEFELGEAEGYTTLKEYASKKLEDAGFTNIHVSEKGVVSTIYTDKNNKTAYIPEGYVASEITGEDTIEGGLVIYEGTEVVNNKNKREAQTTRNQYVWVPVDKISNFKRTNYVGTSVDECKSYDTSDVDEVKEYMAMYNSVNEHGGFYIARYEAGKEGTDTLVSKKNAAVWNAINWYDSKEKCDTMSTDGVVGHLIYGEEWDAALEFISKRGIKDTEYATDSTGKGWYSDNYEAGNPNHLTGIDVGNDAENKLNNIYDMAGNVWEWTMESYSSTNRVRRGGDYGNGGTLNPASYRNYSNASSTSNHYGFRPALYLK